MQVLVLLCYLLKFLGNRSSSNCPCSCDHVLFPATTTRTLELLNVRLYYHFWLDAVANIPYEATIMLESAVSTTNVCIVYLLHRPLTTILPYSQDPSI
jgi:hypothetical protein